jgi:hypothetical protein
MHMPTMMRTTLTRRRLDASMVLLLGDANKYPVVAGAAIPVDEEM